MGSRIPPLWIFTDRERLPDPRAALTLLPKGLCGVVYRPGGAVDPVVASGVMRVCRQRRFAMVVAGDPREAARLHAGRHLSRGWRSRPRGLRKPGDLVTASAHGWSELVGARRSAVDAVFLSPVFATASHPGAPGLGVARWGAMARGAGRPALALGGVTGVSVRRLPRSCAGAGVIGAALGLAFAGAKG
jgi:thiamine-phosphate pyrophosphorylase